MSRTSFKSAVMYDTLVTLKVPEPFHFSHSYYKGPDVSGEALCIAREEGAVKNPYLDQVFDSAVSSNNYQILVTGSSCNYALAGEVYCKYLENNGFKGILVDGLIRDSDDVEMSVSYNGTSPASTNGRCNMTSVGGSYIYQGVQICTGDFLVMDQDGGVRVPREFLVEALLQYNYTEFLDFKIVNLITGNPRMTFQELREFKW